MANSGKAGVLNHLTGVSGLMTTNTVEMATYNKALPKGVAVYNTDTCEIKVSDGIRVPAELPDHRHPYTYAPLTHSHMFGTNEPWLVSNPRLWYTDDLVNHPELVALDGSEIADDRAVELSKVYPGTRLVTNPVTTLSAGSGYENSELTMNVDVAADLYLGSNLFNDELSSQEMVVKLTDQWLTGDADLNKEHSVTVQLKNDWTYRPVEYWMMPANGTATALGLLRPTPKSWVFEGAGEDGVWETVDQQTDVTDDWRVFKIRVFKVTPLKSYSQFRLRITAWNDGQQAGLETGLRRFWIFGRKPNVFSLPDVPSPHPAFSWVVPYEDINTGLKHEDIGDIGTTGIDPQFLPKYRLPTDGRAVKIDEYPELFAVLGYKYCTTAAHPNHISVSDGEIQNTTDDIWAWNSWLTDIDDVGFVDYEMATPGMLCSYKIDTTGYRRPVSWTIEAKAAGDEGYTTLQTYENVLAEDFAAADGTFYIDTSAERKSYTFFRINITMWAEGSEPIGFANVEWRASPDDSFYLPTVSVSTKPVTTYIVARNTADDVSSDIIQRLQQNVIDLGTALSALQNQVNNLDDSIEKPEGN